MFSAANQPSLRKTLRKKQSKSTDNHTGGGYVWQLAVKEFDAERGYMSRVKRAVAAGAQLCGLRVIRAAGRSRSFKRSVAILYPEHCPAMQSASGNSINASSPMVVKRRCRQGFTASCAATKTAMRSTLKPDTVLFNVRVGNNSQEITAADVSETLLKSSARQMQLQYDCAAAVDIAEDADEATRAAVEEVKRLQRSKPRVGARAHAGHNLLATLAGSKRIYVNWDNYDASFTGI